MRNEKDFHFNVFVHQKWTPYLMMVTLFNSISRLNDFADEATYRLERRGGAGRAAEYFALARCRPRAICRARAHGAGRLVGRQVQPAVPATP